MFSPRTPLLTGLAWLGVSVPAAAWAQAGQTASWPGIGLATALALSAAFAVVALKRETGRLPGWIIGGLPAGLALSAMAALIDTLESHSTGRPWAALSLLSGSAALALAWRALRPKTSASNSVQQASSRFSRTMALDLRDNFEHQDAALALRRSNDLFRAILEGTQESLFLMDPQGHLLAVNQTAAARLGKSAQDLIGTLVFDLFPAELSATRREAFFAAVQSKTMRRVEDRRDGRDFATCFYPIADSDGAVEAVSVFAQDITERKRIENQLRESELRYRSLLDNMQVGYLQTDVRTGLIVTANPAMAKIMGVDGPNALIGQLTTRFYANPDDRAAMTEAIKQQGVLRNYPLKVVGPDGRLVPIEFHIRLIPASGDDPPLLEALAIDVSGRLEAEARLRETGQQLRDMADELPCAVFQYRSDREARGRFTFVGGRVRQIDKVSPEAILADPGLLLKTILPADRIAHIASLKRAALTLDNWQSDFRVLGRSGNIRWLHAAAVLHAAPDGQIIWNGYWIDITERKLAEQSVRQSERKYREVFEKLQVGYFKASLEGRIETVNPRAAQLLGYDSIEELCSRTVADVYFNVADREALKSALQSQGKIVNFPLSLRRKDGSELPILANSEFLYDERGQPTHIETSVQDVSELRQLETQLRDGEALFRQHLFGLPVEICICDIKGRVEYANQQYLSSIGYTSEDAPSLRDWWRLAVPEDNERAAYSAGWREATLAVAGTDNASVLPRARLRGKDGVTRIFDITARRLGEQFLVVFSNVTAREEAAAALQSAKEAAEHAALARAQFLATMSHEIRTPLNGIIGMTELAIATATDAEQRRYLKVSRNSADALLSLLNTVLDFSKIEAGRLHPENLVFDLRDSLGEVLDLMRPQAEKKGLALDAQLDPHLPERIVSDPLRLRQIVTNLLANAIKFTETGEIRFSLAVETREADSLRLHLRVQDTGIGIAPERLQSIFGSFVQADGSITRRYGGTGLGLAICARLADLLGGALWAESKLGEGSTFHCTLRVGIAAADDAPAAAPER